MIRKERHIVTGIDQDTNPALRKADVVYDAENIRIINNGRNASVKPLNESKLFVPAAAFIDSLVGYYVVGHVEVNDKLYLFITNNTGTIDAPVPSSPTNYIVEINSTGIAKTVISNTTIAPGVQYTIPGEYELTIPLGITEADVECYGAGGAGEDMTSEGTPGNGGAGGGYAKKTVTLVPGNTYNIIVGAGAKSTNGEDSSFDLGGSEETLAKGGLRGTNLGAGAYQSGNVGDTTYHGGNGGTDNSSYSGGGGGGAGPTGNGGNGAAPTAGTNGGGISGDGGLGWIVDFDNVGNDGNFAGGGGSGGVGQDGGAGAAGAVIISYSATPISSDDLKLAKDLPLEIVANYENEEIVKLYWTDGETMLKSINVENPSGKINIVQEIDISQPVVTVQSNGNLIAGNIQYAYSLYNLNGQETILSPLSQMTPLAKDMKGYESGKSTNLSCLVEIELDTDFDFIRLYSIHYQELNQTPKITLVDESRINGSSYSFIDDGNSSISAYTDNELLSIGNRPYIVGTLAAKRNRLFVANYKANNFDPDIDCRVFSFPSSDDTYYVQESGGSPVSYDTSIAFNVPDEDADCINPDLDTYMYTRNSTNNGATGPNLELRISQINTDLDKYSSLKRGETYRFGVVFYDKYGQMSPAHWLCDYKIPYGIRYYRVYARLYFKDSDARDLAAAQGIVSFQLIMVERKPWDRTVISQGFLVPAVEYLSSGADRMSPYLHPYYGVKDICSSSTAGLIMGTAYTSSVDWCTSHASNNDAVEHDEYMFFYSSDSIFETDLPSGTKITPVGTNYQGLVGAAGTLKRVYEIANKIWREEEYFSTIQFTGYSATYSDVNNFMDTVVNDYIPYIHFRRTYDTTDPSTTVDRTSIDLDEPSLFINTGETKSMGSETLSNQVTIPLLLNDGSKTGYYKHRFPGCVALKFSSATWHQTSSYWDKFYNGGVSTFRRLPIADLCVDVANQYGGNTYEAKQRNEYLKTGDVKSASIALEESLLYGDVWVGPLVINRCDGEDFMSSKYWNIFEYVRITFMEHNHNIYARNDVLYDWTNGIGWDINYQYFRIEDLHKLLGAYNQKETLIKAISKPFNFNAIDEFKNVIQASQEKFANELVDSWLKFPVNDTKNLEGVYGKINKLYNFKGEILAFQDKAIAALAINPRIQTQATDGVNVEMGIGAVLYDHQYLTIKSGISNKFSVVDDGEVLFYHDPVNNTLNVIADSKVSTALAVKNILDTVTFLNRAVHHRKYDEILFLFTGFALVYSTLEKKFVSKFTDEQDFLSSESYFTFGDLLLFHNGDAGIYQKYTGEDTLPSSLTYMFSPDFPYEKVFHNIEYKLYGTDFAQILVTGARENSGTVNLEVFNKFDLHRAHLPRISGSIERWREVYIFVKLIHAGGEDADYSLDELSIMYNIKG